MTSEPIWLATREEDGWTQFRVGRRGRDLIAEWVGLCTLVAREDGSTWELRPEESAPPEVVEKVRAGAARALVLSLHGKLALHGSAVAFSDHAVLLTGRHGAGKSTAAADLCRVGAALLADDIALLEKDGPSRVMVLPSETHHWIDSPAALALGLSDREDQHRDKQGHEAARVARGPVSLVAICELRWRDDEEAEAPPTIVEVVGLDALSTLVPQVVRFLLDDSNARSRELNALIDLASKVRVLRLSRNRGHQWSAEAWHLLRRTLDLRLVGPV